MVSRARAGVQHEGERQKGDAGPHQRSSIGAPEANEAGDEQQRADDGENVAEEATGVA